MHAPKLPKTLKSGFTLVELSLAIAFMSTLLIVIAALIAFVVASYQKGLTIKSVNSVSKAITDDITESISNSYSYDFCAYSTDSKCTPKSVVFKEDTDGDEQISGRFCTGTYSYAWYTGSDKNKDSSGNFNKDYRLLKIEDPNRYVCSSTKMPDVADGEELISASEQQLILYNLSLYEVTQETLPDIAFYSGSFTLGTTTGVNLTETNCNANGNIQSLSSDFNYCAVNQFNFAAKTAGG